MEFGGEVLKTLWEMPGWRKKLLSNFHLNASISLILICNVCGWVST